jgi:lysophospholipid acyltransferase (LPLAT)-like uncharacterized protein
MVTDWLEPLVAGYARAGGALLGGVIGAMARTTKVSARGAAHPTGPSIYAFWHTDTLGGLTYLGWRRIPMVTFRHPVRYLLPWKVAAEKVGWKLVEGSAGHRGREAATQIVEHLRDGWSTFVLVDGPACPLGVAKKGVFHIAAQSGLPIVPLRFRYSRSASLPRWDRMRVPLPASTLHVACGSPFHVTGEGIDEAGRRLTEALGRPGDAV